MYGAEIWGYHSYKSIEEVQTTFCKKLLGLPKHASNLATLGECGRYPIFICTKIRCVKYWLKLLQMSNERYPKACYLYQKQQDSLGKKNWVSNVREILQKYGFGEVWIGQNIYDVNTFIFALKE